jgi:tetratricopeptide (TPR) repeat protein
VSTLFEPLMLVLMLAATVAMVVVSARAVRIEREEGLASSRIRLVAVSVVCAAVTALILGTLASNLVPPRNAGYSIPLPVEPADPLVAAKLKELEKRKTDLYDEIDRLSAELAKLSPMERDPTFQDARPPWYAFDVGALAHFLVPILVMLGTVALFTLGDPATLLKPGWTGTRDNNPDEQDQALTELDRLSQLAKLGKFREGLQSAGLVDAGRLEKFDRLDWAFLKSYCAVQIAATLAAGDNEQRELLETADRDLETLLEQAPNRGEAIYLQAMALGLLGEREKSLAAFEKASPALPKLAAKLPFAHNESVCLLGLAEDALGRGDADLASKLFDQVTKRGVLVDQVPASLVKVRLLNVRRSFQEENHEEAARGIEAVRKLEGLGAEQRRSIDAICEALETLIAVRAGGPADILRHTEAFLTRNLPSGLPEPDEEIVDEFLEAPATGIDLRFSPEIFRAFLFLQAEAQSKIAAQARAPLTREQVRSIVRPLFRALQFELRQRDILATLGGLYFWFVADGRKKGLQWLEAAASLGAQGRIARRLLENEKARELENSEAMEWFHSTSSRFLQDPTVATHVRQALIEELGRFREFQPLLLDLEMSPDLEPREPTLRLLRERAAYLEKMVAGLANRKSGDIGPQLDELRRDYQQLIAGLDASTDRMAEIERRLVQEVGKIIIS